jgi:hypothetical protein
MLYQEKIWHPCLRVCCTTIGRGCPLTWLPIKGQFGENDFPVQVEDESRFQRIALRRELKDKANSVGSRVTG